MTRPAPLATLSQLPSRLGAAVTVRAETGRAEGVRTVTVRADTADSERGDVPGWGLVTLMSALIVVGLIGLLQTQLGNAFTRAMNSVTAP